VSGPLFTKPSRRALVLWASLAALNLGAGVIVSSQPHRLLDLQTVQGWGRDWLLGRVNVYQSIETAVDYPPSAVVLLSPLGLLPPGVAHPLWILLNVGLVILAPYLAARFYRPHDPFRVILLPVLMFLCWGGVRTLSQFTMVALVFSMAALSVAGRRRIAAGAWLGLAMMKPQVAVPVLLWIACTRRWVVVCSSIALAVSLYAVFCAWSHADPVFVLTRYVSILARHHTGDAILEGLSELRPLIAQLVGDRSEVDAIAGSIALGLLAAICVAGMQEGSARRQIVFAAPPLAALWSLMTFYHLTYGFVILLPVLMLLVLHDLEESRLRRALFWLLQLGMMFDIPGLSRRAGLANTSVYANVLLHADRALMVTLFVGLVILAWREPVSERY
jgi:arabinofuranan 3-O-arabinosyltransferase